MPKQKNSVMEYRNYYLPVDFPVLILSGEHWKISDIPSSRLHFHNCLEIGLCHSCSGTMKFYSEPMTFKAGMSPASPVIFPIPPIRTRVRKAAGPISCLILPSCSALCFRLLNPARIFLCFPIEITDISCPGRNIPISIT